MRTALWKITTWQGKLVTKPHNNTYKYSSFTSILSSPTHRTRGKRSKSKPRWRYGKRNFGKFFVKGWQEQKSGIRLPGTPLTRANQSLRELRRLPKNKRPLIEERNKIATRRQERRPPTWSMEQAEENIQFSLRGNDWKHLPTTWVILIGYSQPRKDPQELVFQVKVHIGHGWESTEIKHQHPSGKRQKNEIKFAATSEPPLENRGHQKPKVELPRTDRIPQVFFQKAKVFGIHIVKQKKN